MLIVHLVIVPVPNSDVSLIGLLIVSDKDCVLLYSDPGPLPTRSKPNFVPNCDAPDADCDAPDADCDAPDADCDAPVYLDGDAKDMYCNNPNCAWEWNHNDVLERDCGGHNCPFSKDYNGRCFYPNCEGEWEESNLCMRGCKDIDCPWHYKNRI